MMTTPAPGDNPRSPWDLEGEVTIFEGNRTRSGFRWESEAFTLEQGVVMFLAEHDARGPIKIELSRVSSGFFDSDLTLFEFEGAVWAEMAWVVTPGEWRAPRPNEEYRLTVTASGNWEALMLQPELGQALPDMPFRASGEDGIHLLGPVRNPGRPLLARVQHHARGHFYAQTLPLDGSHAENTFISTEGQTHLDDYPTETLPGKEYLIEVGASGRWELEIYEGY